jgi:predicted dehydrogenase
MGMIGKRHLQAMKTLREAELIAIVDPAEQAKEIALKENVQWFATIEEMLAEVVPVGVIVSTPTEIHLAPTLSALEAGCHVLVEKPIAANLEEARQIQQIAKRVGRNVMVGHHRRCSSNGDSRRPCGWGLPWPRPCFCSGTSPSPPCLTRSSRRRRLSLAT